MCDADGRSTSTLLVSTVFRSWLVEVLAAPHITCIAGFNSFTLPLNSFLYYHRKAARHVSNLTPVNGQTRTRTMGNHACVYETTQKTRAQDLIVCASDSRLSFFFPFF